MDAVSTPTTGSMMQAPHASAVGWGAIAAGAVAALTASIILLTLGAGIGFSAVSPWAGEGASAKTIGASAVAWLVVVQWLSAALGGYIAGRLRLRWNYFDKDEVFFRDTVHGFLSWGLALAVVTVFATSLTTGVLGNAARGAAAGASAQAQGNAQGYFIDQLYRMDNVPSDAVVPPNSPQSREMARGETTRILNEGLGGEIPADDRAYVAKLVAQRTGLSQDEAQKRVDATIVKMKDAADKARKAAAALAIATALALVVGAFISAVAAGIGGRLRDE